MKFKEMLEQIGITNATFIILSLAWGIWLGFVSIFALILWAGDKIDERFGLLMEELKKNDG